MNKVWLWAARVLAAGLVVFGLYVFNSHAPSHGNPAAPGDPVPSRIEAPLNPYAGDPLHPDIRVGWCPGGGAQLLNGKGWCDGVDYPDGSFWHQVPMPYFGVYRVNTFCKLHTGLWLQDAPVGGCGGEWP